jgi:hypothetical protein
MARNDKGRGKLPKASKGTFEVPPAPVNYDQESPKFCLRFLVPGFDVHASSAEKQAAFARTLQKLASFRWMDLKLAPRHAHGSELLPAREFKATIPPRFQAEPKFMVFRYHGNLPMAGVRVDDVYHVLWIEPEFNQLYDHS